MKKYKPYKKNYKVGEKIYKLNIDPDKDGEFYVNISCNTVASIYRKHKPYTCLELKYPDKYGSYINITLASSRTPRGKKFLHKIARNFIKSKILSLKRSEKECYKLLFSSKFK